MKHIFYLIYSFIILTCVCGCVSREGYDVSFEKQYKQLERETRNFTSQDYYDAEKRTANDKLSMTEGDRFATVQIEAQKERRAANKVVGSNYYFEVYPDRKETYSYNSYNEVWSDGYPQQAYKENIRLKEKPKKYKPEEYSGIPDDGLVTEQAIAAAEEAAARAEQEAAEEAAKAAEEAGAYYD